MTLPQGVVPTLKDGPGWYRLPNAAVDLHLPVLHARGLALYNVIARCSTLWEYPGLTDLACSLRCPERKVDQLLDVLLSRGLLNQHDVDCIRGVPP